MSARQRLAAKRKNVQNVTLSVDNETSPTSSKRQKTVTEKRLRRYRSSMTAAIRERIKRALSQRLYLLATSQSSNKSISREYKVLGQTANVYTVIITHIPSCTCPDHGNGHICKHILFVLHRVLKVSRQSPLLYQQALLTDELNDIFAKADSQNNDSSVLAEEQIREAYRAKTDQPNETNIQQKPITTDDECPICFESMINEKTNIIFCSTSCGNNIHKACFEKWRQAKLSMNESVTCPFCRIEWKSTKAKKSPSTDYLNLAAYSSTNDYDEDIYYRTSFDYFNYW